jgi:hypothetical protein
MRPPQWLDIKPTGAKSRDAVEFDVSLARCKGCGKTKATSRPCSFEHLAAVMEFGEALRKWGYLVPVTDSEPATGVQTPPEPPPVQPPHRDAARPAERRRANEETP